MRILLVIAMLLIAPPATAHTLNVSYLDVQQKPEGIVMTAAFHPHQALVIAGLQHNTDDHHEGGFVDLIPELQEHGDLIAAYAATHVTLSANDETCAWDPGHVTVPDTELDALADGVTVSGYVTCDVAPFSTLHIGTSLLFDAFPTSQIIVRLEYPDGFADKLTLTSDRPQGRLALDTRPTVTPTVEGEASYATSRTATLLGWIILAAVLIGAGITIHRMNIASPKE